MYRCFSLSEIFAKDFFNFSGLLDLIRGAAGALASSSRIFGGCESGLPHPRLGVERDAEFFWRGRWRRWN